jgi:phosphate transport system substrate-binding protein
MRRLILLSLLVVVLAVSACAAPAAPAAAPAAATAVAEAVATEAPAAESAPAEAAPAEAGALPEVDPLSVTGDIISAGSSTVYPLTEAVAEQFIDEGYAGNITIDSIGTGGGFERFCVAGETDISNASRAIKDSERESCVAIGRDPLEFRVGTDALAVVVNPGNDWLTAGLTKEQLAMIFSDQTTNWSDVDPSWPAEPIQRFSPGTDSGTFDYFIEAVMNPAFVKDAEADKGKGEEALLKSANLQLSEDDNVLVQGVEGNKNAIGYFGFAYFAENEDKLQAVAIDAVDPSAATVNDGSYPLARPLFIYSDAKVIQEKPQVGQFINYYLTYVNDVIRRVGYFPAPEADLETAKATLATALGQ